MYYVLYNTVSVHFPYCMYSMILSPNPIYNDITVCTGKIMIIARVLEYCIIKLESRYVVSG